MDKVKKNHNIQIKYEELGPSLRLDRFLGQHPNVGSRSRAAKLIQSQLVSVNSKIAKTSYPLQFGDIISVSLPEREPSTLQPYEISLDILYEDVDLIVLNKPAGLVVHPAAGHVQDTLVNALIHHTSDLSMKFGEQRPGIVHRLDKDTSGTLVVAKNDFTHEGLTQQFKEKSVHRIYNAICYGSLRPEKDTIESYLARHPKNRKKFSTVRGENPSERGKLAITQYERKLFDKGLSLVRIQLKTGRTHQIRVHLSEKGFPVVGDHLYSSEKRSKSLSQSLQKIISQMDRFALHARELGFIHPRTREELYFKTDWPKDLLPLVSHCGF